MYLSINKFILYCIAALLIVFVTVGILSMQSNFDPSGGLNRKIQSNLILIIEFFLLVLIVINLKMIVLTKVNIFVFLWIITISFTALISADSITSFIKDLIFMQLWPLSFLASFSLVRKNNKFINDKIHIYSFLSICGLLLFYIMWLIIQTYFYNFRKIVATNQIFYPLCTLPWILLIRKNRIKNTILFLLLISVLLSVKRSAIVSIGIAMFLYIYHTFLKSRTQNKIYKYSTFIFILFFLTLTLNHINNKTNNTIFSRFEKMQTDEGSGRFDIWEDVIDLQMNSNYIEWMFGHGYNAVMQHYYKAGNYLSAHNDFLEVTFDYGLINLLIYLLFILSLIYRLILLRKKKDRYYLSYLISLVIFITMSLVSHLITFPTFFIFISSYWGAIEGHYCNKYSDNRTLLS